MPGPEESEERLGADERFEVAEGDDDLPREERTKTIGDQQQEIDPGAPDPR